MRIAISSCLALLATSSLACSSSSSASGSTPDAGVTKDSASPVADGGLPVDAAEAAAPLTANQLVLASGLFRSGGLTNLNFVNFIADPGQRCAVTTTGPCRVIDCRPGDGGAPPHGVSAGTVTLTKGSATLLTIAPDAAGVYPAASQTTGLFAAGDSVILEAAGGDLPSFSETFTAPPLVTVISPVPDDAGATVVSRNADLAVTWQPVSGGVTVSLVQTPPGAIDVSSAFRTLCEFDGSTGAGTVPAAVVGQLETSAAFPGVTSFNVGGNATRDITPGGYALHLHLTNATTFVATVE
jgi:hypothetical protein